MGFEAVVPSPMKQQAYFTARWQGILAASLVLAVTFVVYLPSLQNGFINWDDGFYVVDNSAIRTLSWPAVKHIFTSPVLGLYHPLSILSLAVEYHFFGLDPLGYHAVSLALHLVNTLLVLVLLRILSGNPVAALAGSLLFGLHPLQVESVAWIAERKNVLSAAFFFCALLAYLRHIGGTRRRGWYLLAFGLLTASLLSKPMGVTFPLVMYLCDYLKARSLGWRVHIEKIPFAALSLFWIYLTLAGSNLVGTTKTSASFTADNVFLAAYGLLFYFFKAILPVDLSALYPYPEETAHLLPWRFLLSPALVTLAGVIVLRSARLTRHIPFGLLYFAGTLIPVLSLKIGPHLVADRYFYLPSLGICHLAGVGFSRLFDGPGRGARMRTAVAATLALVTIVFSALTWQRTLLWRDSLTFWDHVIATDPGPGVAYQNRGVARLKRGNALGAIEDLTIFLRSHPYEAETFIVRGNAFLQMGNVQAAFGDFDRALQVRPDLLDALNNRGVLLAKRGALRRAIDDFSRALSLNPRYRTALENRARTRAALGDQTGAEQDLARIIELESQRDNSTEAIHLGRRTVPRESLREARDLPLNDHVP